MDTSEYENMKKSGELKSWKCSLCTSSNLTSFDADMSKRLVSECMTLISGVLKSTIEDSLRIQFRGVIDELRKEVKMLKQENIQRKPW